MIQICSVIKVKDNSGVKKVKVFHVKGNRRFGLVGDVFIGSVIKSQPSSRYKKGDIIRGLFVKTTKHTKFPNHPKALRFIENSCILISSLNEPLGSRVFGVCCFTLRKTGFIKVLSLINKTV